MNEIREQIKNPLVVGVIGFVVGAIIGLVLLGWYVFPVKWVNAYPRDLAYDQKVEYLRTAIEAFGQNGDVVKAKARYTALETDKEKALADIVKNPQGLPPQLVMNFSDVAMGKTPVATTAVAPVSTTPGAPTQAAPGATPAPTATPTPAKKSALSILWPILCILALVLVAVLVYIFIIRGRNFGPIKTVTPAMQAEEARREATWTDYSAQGAQPPIAQFMASYKLGDDLFDDSFSIDSASGEFLGECGVGISETVGVGDPKKVTAFEVWLFDKNDIQTVTKVLMSAHAFQDGAIRQRLEAKGEPVLATPGSEAVLETQTLQLTARVVNMGYGEGAMPADSYFDTLVLELAIWQK